MHFLMKAGLFATQSGSINLSSSVFLYMKIIFGSNAQLGVQ